MNLGQRVLAPLFPGLRVLRCDGEPCGIDPYDADLTARRPPRDFDRDGHFEDVFSIDGVLRLGDDCPFVPNRGQKDADGDGVGDACEGAACIAGGAPRGQRHGLGRQGGDFARPSSGDPGGDSRPALLLLAGTSVAERRRMAQYPGRPDRPSLPLLVLSTGTACSLRCRDCSAFGPSLEPVAYDGGSVIDGLRRVGACVGEIDRLLVEGGEPFLHEGLAAVVVAARALPNVRRIEIATNGMQPMPVALVEACRDPKVSVRVSRYEVPSAAACVEALLAQLRDEGVAHVVDPFADGHVTWTRFGDLDRGPDTDDAVVARRFDECTEARCPTLANGVLARCPRGAVAAFAGQVPYDDESYVNVGRYDGEHLPALAAAIAGYLARPTFMEACRRCEGTRGERIAPAVQAASADGARRPLVPVDLDDRGCVRGD